MSQARLRLFKEPRGDTLIEVIFAITIFSLVVVGGLSIMNKGVATSQRSLEITLVRQQIDAQAESLRFLNIAYIAAFDPTIASEGAYNNGYLSLSHGADQWSKMVKGIINTGNAVSNFGNIANSYSCPASVGNNYFIINTKTADYNKLVNSDPEVGSVLFNNPSSYSQLRYNSGALSLKSVDGIWIEAARSATSANLGYIDFHIRACWSSIGQAVPVTLSTIVRLYEPRRP